MSGPIQLGPLHSFILTVLPTAAVVVFILGLVLRIRSWRLGLPQFRFAMRPTAKDIYATARQLSRKGFSSTWLLLWPFHMTFLVIFFGHLRGIGIWSADWFTWLAPKEFLTKLLPNIVGVIFLLAIIFHFGQRLGSTNMQVPPTRFSDYIFIVLIVAIACTGMAMRFLPHMHGELSFQLLPGITMTLDKIPQLDILAIHALLSEFFIMYIPFSRLMHMITGLVT